MIEYINKLLTEDLVLAEVLGDNAVNLIEGDDVRKQIIFNVIPISSDGIKNLDRLEITIIAFKMDDIELITKRLNNILLTIGDEPKEKIKECALNGGGLLRNHATNTFHKKLYYNMRSYTKGE